MTVAQYSALPEPVGGRYELHHGELVFVTFVKHGHALIQNRIKELLDPLAKGRGVVWTEYAFRPLPEYELRSADVAFVSAARIAATDRNDYLRGAPEIVVEVLSPSNRTAEMVEKETLCLENGCLEFWLVDPKRKTVRVATPDRRSITYIESEKIPLTIPAPAELPVAEIFP